MFGLAPYNLLLNAMTAQASDLGMSYSDIAERSGVSIATVKRFFSGRGRNTSYDNVDRIAQALGIVLGAAKIMPASAIRQSEGKIKAKIYADALVATMALEAENLDARQRSDMEQKIMAQLLAGSSRKLWK